MTGSARHEHAGTPLSEVLALLERDGFTAEAAQLHAAAAGGRSMTLARSTPVPGQTTLLRRVLRHLEREAP